MKRSLKIIGLILLLLLAVGAITFFFFPGTIVNMTNSQFARAAQLEQKVISVNDYSVNYYVSKTKDKAETLVLLHGMGDDKNSFLQSAKILSEHYNLILPDLAGHGENERNPTLDYSIYGQASFLHDFLQELKIDTFHLGGNSMGGHTAAAYAINFPQGIKTLTLLNAPGVKLDDHVVYTGFGEPIKNKAELKKVLDRVFYKSPDLPGPIANYMIEQVNNSKDFVDQTLVPAIKQGKNFDLKKMVSKIKAPTLILWGAHDVVVKFNVAEYFHKNIPISSLELIDDAAHSPQLERPDRVANSIISFIKTPKTDLMKSTKLSHAAKVQLYRWYQLYERPFNQQRIDNQMDILAETVSIKSAAGEMKGKENYPARLKAYEGWQNAHHVQEVSVQEREDGSLALSADIIYQNIQPDGKQNSYTIHYDTDLQIQGEELPQFTQLHLQPTGTIENPDFEDAYPVNRTKALMYYWLVTMEQLAGDVSPFKEMLTDDFVLNFSTSSQITTLQGLETWLNGKPKQLKLSSHFPENFSVEKVGKNEYKMLVDFNWLGSTKTGQALKAKTHHEWLIVDDPNERFARIKQADVNQIEPFSPM